MPLLTIGKLLALLAALGPKIPTAYRLIMELIALFSEEIDAIDGGLEMTAPPTPEEEAAIATITAALSADGTQAALDLSRFRKLVKVLNDSGVADMLIKLLTRAAAGS